MRPRNTLTWVLCRTKDELFLSNWGSLSIILSQTPDGKNKKTCNCQKDDINPSEKGKLLKLLGELSVSFRRHGLVIFIFPGYVPVQRPTYIEAPHGQTTIHVEAFFSIMKQ